jgi:acyl-CoA synthetase (AMP-forming)/AMP-acid ligase II
LAVQATARPEQAALWVPEGDYVAYTFADLHAASDEIALRLPERFVGARAAVLIPPSFELFATLFGLLKAGVVPVLVDPGIGVRRMGHCLEETAPALFIGVQTARWARTLLGWCRSAATVRVGGDIGLVLAGAARTWSPRVTGAADTAAILFTSGSTGAPKGVVVRHGHFRAQVEVIRRLYGIEAGETDIPTFPLFALFDPVLGVTAVLPKMDFTCPARADPRHLLHLIERFAPTQMFASPALLDSFGRYGLKNRVRLDSLRRVISAGAPVQPRILRTFRSLLSDQADIHTPYGATECLPVSSICDRTIHQDTSARTAAGAGVCVGEVLPENRVWIVGITDTAIARLADATLLPDGTIGEIVVQGPTTTTEYFGRPEATSLAKIALPDGSTAHRMGDLGYFDAERRLWFCGRKVERLRMTPERYTVPNEMVFNQHPAVTRSALVEVLRPPGSVAVLVVEGRAPRRSADVVAELRRMQPPGGAVAHILFKRRFPVDVRHNAKIDRAALARWAAARIP